jgi:cytoskeletal protein RodZ
MPSAKTDQDSQQGMLVPITTILLGLLLLMFLLGRPVDTPYAQEDDRETATASATPEEEAYTNPTSSVRTSNDDPYTEPTETRTSRQTSAPQPSSTSTTGSEQSERDTDTNDTEPEPTSSQIPQNTSTPTVINISEPEATRTLRPSSTSIPTPLQTATETPLPNSLVCPMGEITVIEGTAPPNTAVVAYFEDRTVGGATSDAAGIYRLPLDVGSEYPRNYLIQIRIRQTYQLLREVICEVPTPTPGLRERFGLP